MLLYSARASSRLSYISAFIGQELFSRDLKITTNKEEFKHHEGPKINYSGEAISVNEFRIVPVELLFEKNIKNQAVTCFNNKTYKAFFQTNDSDFSFDLFAASFYLLSRYEEYLDHKKDHYGRYAHINSLAHKEKFLHLPLVNIWLQHLKKTLAERYPGITFIDNHFSFLPTYDIDIAYSFLHKGWWRNAGGFVRSIIKGEWNDLIDRTTVLSKRRSDPFDCYEWLNRLHSNCRMKALYFFLVAAKQKGYDKNISPSTFALQQLIIHHSARFKIGIHPSWQSGDSNQVLKEEIKWLETISGKEIRDSRQHYLRFALPETYRKLISTGIEKDYSMGYGSTNGFRASVASSFWWYDLQKEECTGLRIYPFCFMDTNAYYQQRLTPLQAFDELVSYFNSIKAVNGLMITIWHNHILGTGKAFTGWREVYERFVLSGFTEC